MAKAKITRQFILERTAPLFNKKGFEGTSMSDLTEATGLTKGAIYGNFEDKEQIAREAFRFSVSEVRKTVKKRLEPAVTFRAKLEALLGFYAGYVFDPPVAGGCPLLNAAIEVDDDHISMRRMVSAELTRTVEFIASLIEKGKEKGEFRSNTDPRQTAFALFCAVEGAVMFSRAVRSREPMDHVVNHCRKILDQITI